MFTDICGPQGATQAIGFLLGLCSIPLTVGPPIAGMLYDHTKSYSLSFLLAGIPALFGAAMMSLIYCVPDDRSDSNIIDPEQAHVPLAKPAWLEGMSFPHQTDLIANFHDHFVTENLIEVKLPNGNNAGHSLTNGNAKSNHIASSGINEKSGLLSSLNLSTLVMDITTLNSTFQSHIKRKYCYGEL